MPPTKTKKKKPVAKKKVAAKKTSPKTAASKPAKKVNELDQLKAVVKELNDVIDFEPALKVASIGDMKKQIKSELDTILDEDPLTKETWAVLKKLGYKSSEGGKKKKASAAHDKTSAKKSNKSPKTTGKKGQGIIATVIAILERGKPVTKAQIVAELAKKFPDRAKEGMTKTVAMQCPGRLNRERDLNIKTDGKGKFFIK